MTKIYHAHLYGSRNGKYDWLLSHDVVTTSWQTLQPQSPFYLLIPQNTDLLSEYEQGWKITDVMPVNVLGFQTHRDHFAIDFDREKLEQRIVEMRDEDISDDEYTKKYTIADNRDWKVREARQKLRNDINWDKPLINCAYRPFDNRSCYFSDVTMDYPRRELLDHVAGKENLCLLVSRQISLQEWRHVFICDQIAESCVVSNKTREQNYNFPLYLYPDCNELIQENRVNFSPHFLKDLTTKLGYKPTPEAVLYYIYAIFHSPTYRSHYAEFLKIDFPRVPLTSNDTLFQQLANYGKKMVALHLMKSPKIDTLLAHFEGSFNPIVDAGHPKYVDSKVVINKKGDGFTEVPEEVWNFYVGGYQVCQKWLKDRKGRTLSQQDIIHYQRIVVALQETIRVMQQIDEAIPGFPLP
ncbi:type ISP restriction/modification enzyme [Microcoleus sp. Z1_C3]|uniref:type ISP restriction/modification enzyme n=1 Tax=unclassified Microcoleus TaxID=2642155 RepID=UPI002FD18B4E